MDIKALASSLPGKVFYKNATEYSESIGSYYSQQEQSLYPSCIIKPANAQDVSHIVKVLSEAWIRYGQQFAVRSGGHTPWAGAANIAGAGVTLDLSGLDQVEVVDDQETTKIGPGALWGDVYKKLDAMNLSVVGGRVSQVGVGGLSLGGAYEGLLVS